MCWTSPQILIVIGLVFQALSVLYSAKRFLLNYFKSIEEKKLKYAEEEGKTIPEIIEERDKTLFWTTLLLFIGLVFQGIAEFVR